MAAPTGLAASCPRIWVSASLRCRGSWFRPKYNRTDWIVTWRGTIPKFETKAADIIGLYMNPPQHAAVFCVDEKTAIQALDRLDPVLPLSPGRAERHGFEYYRHGTLSLYAALNVKTGTVEGKTAPRHTSAEFVAFLTELVGKGQVGARDSHRARQSLGAQNTGRRAVPRAESQGPASLYPHLLLLAESSRDLVRENRARCYRPWSLHLGRRSSPEINEVYPRLCPPRPPHPLELH